MNRANVLGVGVHAVNLSTAADIISDAASADEKVTCASPAFTASWRRNATRPLSKSSIGPCLSFQMVFLRYGSVSGKGTRKWGASSGPDLMMEVCRRSVSSGTTHFLYGGKPGVAEELQANLESWFPGIHIVGTCTPPFRPLSSAERADLEEQTSALAPDIIWVGLSTPKQEQFMAEHISVLRCKIMVGVGAAFDIHTGRVKDAPQWIKTTGLQWFHRLCQEPSRLWKRYLVNNSGFVVCTALQFLGFRRYELESPETSTEF